MPENIVKTADGAIVYDSAVIKQITPKHFSVDGWAHAEAVAGDLNSSGRGSTMFVGNIPRQFVLRHYMRGGLVGKLIKDKYLFSSAEGTRPFEEWRLLAKLVSRGLRVPKPAAARYVRRGLFYQADLLTVRIPDVQPLSAYITGVDRGADFWSRLGAEIAVFHAHGVLHADMNAYNLQIDKDGDMWMLDFDKGRLAQPGRWQQQTLSRLHRSLEKIKRLDPAVAFSSTAWSALLEGYFTTSKSAAKDAG